MPIMPKKSKAKMILAFGMGKPEKEEEDEMPEEDFKKEGVVSIAKSILDAIKGNDPESLADSLQSFIDSSM